MAQNKDNFLSSITGPINDVLSKLSKKEKISYSLIALGFIFIIIGIIML